ncbi:bifunctional 4-hydroxy-2-oxoglutarate aldolase/2-dehydro-3-deoxy-phosphogluconate aldolase [Amnibacterium flavum]|uniref:2-dehydro-3-deoxyphosphogluconate aldolase n=1 Tax=Amnibacterium flavum TaxID=2173173 RepID=A0A2V1HWI5_9MICO|nr:bifunctional 4-hydroxy-2-oxoglutarate aldolase/2-dehydro-3-deoxy-phosphogluconate aldolase [Amnibacterium flavum]PVZ94564.1 2-dehydro-3-deoxyphosphogluconate aldolase [Amnibacterium flavum]
MNRSALLPTVLQESPIIAILRGGREDRVIPVAETLIENGVRCLEITTNTPGWQDAITALASRPEVLVGVGTVLTVEHVEQAKAAGAEFLVSPDTNLLVGEAGIAAGMGWYPGALTPTEIVTAYRAGATAVKVFPASAMGGPSYLKNVLAPLDYIPLVPTGGVDLDMIADYLAAGAVAVGLGSPLIGDALTGGSLDALAARARRAVEAVSDRG